MNNNRFILADGRWSGPNGIGRFSQEILKRLVHTDIITEGPHPLSLSNFFWLPYKLHNNRQSHKIFFTPGFNPTIYSPLPVFMTLHDLIHLHLPGNAKIPKKIFYETVMKPAVRRAYRIFTVSEYSKQSILKWSGIPESKIVVVGNGVSEIFTIHGAKYQPGYPYLLHVGNTKIHKNVIRLVEAFATAKIDSSIRLLFTGDCHNELADVIQKNQITHRVVFTGSIPENNLAALYRGATALTFPSLLEGFGLPPLEAMGCGTPTLVSNVTSLPEVVGDAALCVDPYDLDSIRHGIEKIVTDNHLRASLIEKGFARTKIFSWDSVARNVQNALNIML